MFLRVWFFNSFAEHKLNKKMQQLHHEQLTRIGLKPRGKVFHQLQTPELIELAVHHREGDIAEGGAFNMMTGEFTGRSPKDRYIVQDDLTNDAVDWNEINQPLSSSVFDVLYDRTIDYLNDLNALFLRDANVASYKKYSQRIRFVSEKATQDLFIQNMFLPPTEIDNRDEWTVLVASSLKIDNYAGLGLRSSNVVVLDLSRRKVLIIGTGYTGEIKKSMFSIMNFILPYQYDVLPMHCSANIGEDGNTALFFGLSGTGKTTLSADKGRYLIGDDEHGWSNEGVFNFEGGCYAKCIGLKSENEPDIYQAVRFGALTENILFREGSRTLDFENKSITENIRVSYPLNYISSSVKSDKSPSPKHIFFLTADAFGILPPLSRLSIEQAMYYFVNGYTAKVAGTEVGISHPVATFSACFGQAFLPLHPMQYANMLRDRLQQDPSIQVWLVNTGWIGGPYGVGRRISIHYTRAMIRAVMQDQFDDVLFVNHDMFGLAMPTSCPQVPDEILNPKGLWQNQEAYDVKAKELKSLFETNYKKYKTEVVA